MGETLRILVVEDEEPIRDGIVSLLEQQEFQVDGVGDGHAALERLAAERYSAVILDWMVPGATGIEVLQALRSGGDTTPVLLLTARGSEDDIVTGLEAGADDYVTKPFGIRELVARVRGLARRAPAPRQETGVVQLGSAYLDTGALEVRWDEGTVSLTDREARFLGYLLKRRDRAVTREELLEQVWGYTDGTIRTRTVDVHVQQLRAKLVQVPGAEHWIGTVRGRGYRFLGIGP